jgi:hypothetical protein
MRRTHYTLTSRQVQDHAAALVQRHLGLADFSLKCSADLLLHVLFVAAARMVSLVAAALGLARAPSAETLRQALLSSLPDYAQLQRGLNRALVGGLPQAMRRRRQRLAIDLHLVPYYGRHFRDPQEVYRSQTKAGTNRFHAYATAYVVLHGQRFTVALLPIEAGSAMKDVVQRLLAQARKAGVRPALLLMDRGFYSVPVARYLQAARVPFLMPAVARGKAPKGKLTGIRAFRRWKRSGWGRHTWAHKKLKATVSICVHCGNDGSRRPRGGRRQRHGRYTWVYAYWGFRPRSTRWVADTYRQRFGIETSYRQLRQARATTCTRRPEVRLLLVGLALLLRNVWVWLHWEVLSERRRGGRRLRLAKLRFKALLRWLVDVAQAVLGINNEVDAQRPTTSKVGAVP